jgi:hypothetical protein
MNDQAETRTNYCVGCKEAADRITALKAENERLRGALLAVWEWEESVEDGRLPTAIRQTVKAALAGKAGQ